MKRGTQSAQALFRFKPAWTYDEDRVVGYFTGCGNAPTFIAEFKEQGTDLPRDVFRPKGMNE